jgi:hypothetical protein
MTTTTTKMAFETECGEYRVEGKTFRECRINAGRLLSVSGPRSLSFSEIGGGRAFYTSLYDGEDYYTDAAGKRHTPR